MRPLLFLVIFVLTGCINELEIPEDILPQEKMVEVLTEFHLLESKLEALNISTDSAYIMYRHFEPQVYEKFEVESSHYQKSLDFYMNKPQLLHPIYEAVVDSLMLREKNRRIN